MLLVCATALGLSIGFGEAETSVSLFGEFVLPLFFVGVGMELRSEFESGYFVARSNITAPLIAAVLGVIAPALIYIALVRDGSAGWAVPTATDLPFGLAALTLASVKLRSRIRPRFLAVATFDDVIGLVILAVLFSSKLQPGYAFEGLAALVAYWVVQRFAAKLWFIALPIACLALYSTALSGIQTSLVGVLIGLLYARSDHRHRLEVLNGCLVVPVFAFLVGASVHPTLSSGLNAVILAAILVRPFGKIVGITLGGALGDVIQRRSAELNSWLTVGILGGIGFTVSLLIANLAYQDSSEDRNSAIVGTMLASAISVIVFYVFIKVRALRARQDEKSL
jgi:NhaA family Na+:H+ antiporter